MKKKKIFTCPFWLWTTPH